MDYLWLFCLISTSLETFMLSFYHWFLISFHCSWKTYVCMISVFWNLLSLFYNSEYSFSWWMFYIYSIIVWWSALHMSVRSSWFMVLFSYSITIKKSYQILQIYGFYYPHCVIIARLKLTKLPQSIVLCPLTNFRTFNHNYYKYL